MFRDGLLVEHFEMVMFIMRGAPHPFVSPLLEKVEFPGIIDFVGLKTVHDIVVHQARGRYPLWYTSSLSWLFPLRCHL